MGRDACGRSLRVMAGSPGRASTIWRQSFRDPPSRGRESASAGCVRPVTRRSPVAPTTVARHRPQPSTGAGELADPAGRRRIRWRVSRSGASWEGLDIPFVPTALPIARAERRAGGRVATRCTSARSEKPGTRRRARSASCISVPPRRRVPQASPPGAALRSRPGRARGRSALRTSGWNLGGAVGEHGLARCPGDPWWHRPRGGDREAERHVLGDGETDRSGDLAQENLMQRGACGRGGRGAQGAIAGEDPRGSIGTGLAGVAHADAHDPSCTTMAHGVRLGMNCGSALAERAPRRKRAGVRSRGRNNAGGRARAS